jgi:hypothetical protein
VSVATPPPFTWNTTRGRLRIDIADKDAVYEALDSETVRPSRG